MTARRARRRPVRSRFHRLTAGATALAVIVCQAPIPAPTVSAATGEAAAGKDRSVPFPCMDRPCGCDTAARCWESCCCLSRTERLAWAERNGVTPPAFVTAPEPAPAPSAAKPACCRKAAPAKNSRCSPAAKPRANDAGDEASAVVSLAAAKCRGDLPACGALPWAVPPALCGLTPPPSPTPRGPGRAVRLAPAADAPPTPPPRIGRFGAPLL